MAYYGDRHYGGGYRGGYRGYYRGGYRRPYYGGGGYYHGGYRPYRGYRPYYGHGGGSRVVCNRYWYHGHPVRDCHRIRY